MTTVATLRDLWARRGWVGVGLVVALAGALLLSVSVRPGLPPELETRQYKAGVAGAKVFIDSPMSQVVDVGGSDSDVGGQATDLGGLSTRAHLLAALMASSPLSDRIAEAAGVPRERFLVIPPTGDEPSPADPPGAARLAEDRRTTVIDLFVDEAIPIISVNVRAPDATTAARTARAAVEQLLEHVESVAANSGVSPSYELNVTPLGGTSEATVVRGPRRLFAVAAFLLISVLWCLGLVLRPRVGAVWREVMQTENTVGVAVATGDIDAEAAAARGEPAAVDDPPREVDSSAAARRVRV